MVVSLFQYSIFLQSVFLMITALSGVVSGSSYCSSGRREICSPYGQIVTIKCNITAQFGILDWESAGGFDCPNEDHSVNDNKIVLIAGPCPHINQFSHCGPFNANLTCSEDGRNLISVLRFEANSASFKTHSETFRCIFNHETLVEKKKTIGEFPEMPKKIALKYSSEARQCQYEWEPPQTGVEGEEICYKINYNENCGICDPMAGTVSNETLTATCPQRTRDGPMRCKPEVRTVTDICGLESKPAQLISEIDMIETNTSPTLTARQCIEVSVINKCNESALLFQALLQLNESECGARGTPFNSIIQTLSEDYTTCVNFNLPATVDTVCYYAVVFYMDGEAMMEVGRTKPQPLILKQCDTNSLVLSSNVRINSNIGAISLGQNISHNTVLYFNCDTGCTLQGDNITQCTNGTFQPVNITFCACPRPINVGAIAGGIVGGAVLLALIIVLVVFVIIYCRRQQNNCRWRRVAVIELDTILKKQNDE